MNAPKGSFDGPARASTIDANDQLRSAQDYRSLVISYKNGRPIALTDVADVVDQAENVRLAAWANQTPAIVVNIQRQPGANVMDTVQRLQDQLPVLRASLPPGVDVQVLTDRTVTIRASVRDVQFEWMLSVALVVMVIFLFLRSASATLIPAVVEFVRIRAAAQRHGHRLLQSALGSRGGPHVGAHGNVHAEEAGQAGAERANQERDRREHADRHVLIEHADDDADHDGNHHCQDADGLVLAPQERHCAFEDGTGHFLHRRGASISAQNVARQPEREDEREAASVQNRADGRVKIVGAAIHTSIHWTLRIE